MDTERLSHAYIIAGPPEECERRAEELTAAMLCEAADGRKPCGTCRSCRKLQRGVHPDRIVVCRTKDDKGKLRREIYVDQIRDMAASAVILPSEAERKVYVIREAGLMNPPAQNALLKLLEEPPRFVSLILLCDNADQLLETVRSRCVLLHVRSGEAAPPAEARELAERWLDLAAANARISLISFANANESLSPAELTDFTRAARGLLADMLCRRLPDRGMTRARLMELVRLTNKSEEYLRFNGNVKQVLGMLCVETPERGIK